MNVRYLTGYAGSNGMVVIEPGGATFITDFRYVTAAEPIRDFMDVKMAEREAMRSPPRTWPSWRRTPLGWEWRPRT